MLTTFSPLSSLRVAVMVDDSRTAFWITATRSNLPSLGKYEEAFKVFIKTILLQAQSREIAASLVLFNGHPLRNLIFCSTRTLLAMTSVKVTELMFNER
jgi:hypothetical protein